MLCCPGFDASLAAVAPATAAPAAAFAMLTLWDRSRPTLRLQRPHPMVRPRLIPLTASILPLLPGFVALWTLLPQLRLPCLLRPPSVLTASFVPIVPAPAALVPALAPSFSGALLLATGTVAPGTALTAWPKVVPPARRRPRRNWSCCFCSRGGGSCDRLALEPPKDLTDDRGWLRCGGRHRRFRLPLRRCRLLWCDAFDRSFLPWRCWFLRCDAQLTLLAR